MREAIRMLEWTQRNAEKQFNGGETPQRDLGEPVTVTVKCMASKLSRRNVPAASFTVYEGDSLYVLLCDIERHTGIPVGRQVVAVVDGNKKVQRIPAAKDITIKGGGLVNGCSLLVAECGPVTIDVRMGPGSKVRLRCYPDEKVEAVKECLVTKANCGRNGMVLMMDGSEVGPDSATLWECGVRCGTVLMELKRKERDVRVRTGEVVSRVAVGDADNIEALRKKVAVATKTDYVKLIPEVPDSIIVRHCGVTDFTAKPNIEASQATALASQIHSIHSSLTHLAHATTTLQDTVYSLTQPVEPDPYALPLTTPPSTLFATATDSITHVANKLQYPSRTLDIVKS
eukprot:TRINITY_DN33986_c0_g1_i1.p1 TRINITY_DN33986_c0_g1~~TRINITY_DN33986_c0_g1_i1.p1  ORF type:complete len:399 (+),score=80.71 TRINITY_DN33986_c0_g1_i1:170-1198(+)